MLSLQHSGSDSSHAQFAAYWKPVLSMDANSWQRWLHMHRLVLILEHDTWVFSSGRRRGGGARVRGRRRRRPERPGAGQTPTLSSRSSAPTSSGGFLKGEAASVLRPRGGAWRGGLAQGAPSSQADPQAPAHPGQQRPLQHGPVQDLALLADLPAPRLEQLRARRGLLLCEAAVQVGRCCPLVPDPPSSSSRRRPARAAPDAGLSPGAQSSPPPPST